LGAIAVKNLGHQRAIQNISENRHVRGFACRGKLQIDFVKVLLGMIQKNQQARAAAGERLHESGADAASSPRNEDGLAGVRCAEQRCVHVKVQFATEMRARPAESLI
jgi:hypothetical protein